MNNPIQGKELLEEDIFYIEWNRETIKKNIEIAHGVLTQMLTLNTALLGGSVIFFSQGTMGKSYQFIAAALFFLGLAISFLGIFPHSSTISSISPSEIKEHKNRALKRKCNYMKAAGAFTGAGFIVVSLGALCA